MGDSLPILRRRIKNAEDLRAVVRSMKAMSSASITQFEQAVDALQDYHRAVELALSVCLRNSPVAASSEAHDGKPPKLRAGIVVLGSDQGMVGQFNEHIADTITADIAKAAQPPILWVVGERVQARLENAGHRVDRLFPTPQYVEAIAPLVSDLLFEIETQHIEGEVSRVRIYHNAPLLRSNYMTKQSGLLPFDQSWRDGLTSILWPTTQLPEMIDRGEDSRAALVSEYLFVSLYQACAASCAAEHAARLASMQRAEKNIDDQRRVLDLQHNHKRQSMIDEELFDLISGFEALTDQSKK